MSDKSKSIDGYVKLAYSCSVRIKLSTKAKKQLKKVPLHIQTKFKYWCDFIGFVGLLAARKYKGFHDEPLKGKRRGQRSIRLSKSYRAIYVELDKAKYEIIEIIEVNKHEY